MGARKRILIVDDEDKILFVLHHALARLGTGYEVVTSNSAREALEIARHRQFDLIMTDLRMPNLDGVAFTEVIRAADRDVIVIWMTAYDYHTKRLDAERLGVYCCLDKPLEITEIRQIVCQALGNAEEFTDGRI